MTSIPFNASLQSPMSLNDEQLAELEEKRVFLQQQAHDIIAIAEHQSNSALNCLHKISVMGGTSEKAYQAIEQRILLDQDAHGAYHAVALAQTTSDLPFDVPVLVDIVVAKGEPALQLRLLKLFDSQPVTAEPIPKIRASISQSGEQKIIEQLNHHLANYH